MKNRIGIKDLPVFSLRLMSPNLLLKLTSLSETNPFPSRNIPSSKFVTLTEICLVIVNSSSGNLKTIWRVCLTRFTRRHVNKYKHNPEGNGIQVKMSENERQGRTGPNLDDNRELDDGRDQIFSFDRIFDRHLPPCSHQQHPIKP